MILMTLCETIFSALFTCNSDEMCIYRVCSEGECEENETTVEESEECSVTCCDLAITNELIFVTLYKGSGKTFLDSAPWIEKDGEPGLTRADEQILLLPGAPPTTIQEGVVVHGLCNNW